MIAGIALHRKKAPRRIYWAPMMRRETPLGLRRPQSDRASMTTEEKMRPIPNQAYEQWISAAEQLIVKSNRQVGCPACGVPALMVRDVEYGCGPRKGLDRYLLCSHCGSHAAVNLRHAGPLIDRSATPAETPAAGSQAVAA